MLSNTESKSYNHDDSWDRALVVTREALSIPSVLPALIRNSWSTTYDVTAFMHAIGFPGWSPKSLIRAANLSSIERGGSVADIQRAVSRLGVPSAATIVAVNFVCCAALSKRPSQRLWVPLFKELMTGIEIGHLFGSSADGIGPDGGMVMGFAQSVGLLVLLAHDVERFASCHNQTNGFHSPRIARETFGCEPYQVGAFALQQLGFGPEIALASALSSAPFSRSLQVVESNHATTKWKAAYRWIEALVSGASYPSDELSQAMFKEKFGVEAGSDLTQEQVQFYIRVADIRRGRSDWTWHLPKVSYEETVLMLEGSPQLAQRTKVKLQPARRPSGYRTDKRQVSLQD